MRKILTLVTLGVAVSGCSRAPEPTAETVKVTGKVMHQGQPVSGVYFNFHPTGRGLPAVIPVNAGRFEAKVVPGTYTFFVSPASTPSSRSNFDRIPAAYHEGAIERQFKVNATGEELTFALE